MRPKKPGKRRKRGKSKRSCNRRRRPSSGKLSTRSKIFVTLLASNSNKWKIARGSKTNRRKTSMPARMPRFSDRLMKREPPSRERNARRSRKRSATRRRPKIRLKGKRKRRKIESAEKEKIGSARRGRTRRDK